MRKRNTIDQFMWGFQPHFRSGVQYEIERALKEIGLLVEVQVLLVGFALVDDLRHRICVEPEDGPFSVNDLSMVSDRAAELVQADPESRMFISDPRHHGLRHAGVSRRARANALVEAIQASGVFGGADVLHQPLSGYQLL